MINVRHSLARLSLGIVDKLGWFCLAFACFFAGLFLVTAYGLLMGASGDTYEAAALYLQISLLCLAPFGTPALVAVWHRRRKSRVERRLGPRLAQLDDWLVLGLVAQEDRISMRESWMPLLAGTQAAEGLRVAGGLVVGWSIGAILLGAVPLTHEPGSEGWTWISGPVIAIGLGTGAFGVTLAAGGRQLAKKSAAELEAAWEALIHKARASGTLPRGGKRHRAS